MQLINDLYLRGLWNRYKYDLNVSNERGSISRSILDFGDQSACLLRCKMQDDG